MAVVNVTPPVLSGSSVSGQVLTTSNGTWTSADPLVYTYQWERCDAAGANCVDIGNQTGSSYTVQTIDIGHTIRSEVTATENPTPPPAGDTYFDDTAGQAAGLFASPWTTLFFPASPGFYDIAGSGSIASSPDGRDTVVNNPSGSGKVFRFECRNADSWPGNTSLSKSEVRSVPDLTFDNPGGVEPGGVRWFSTRLYMPYGAEKFEWAHGGGNAFTDIMDLHPQSGTAWPAFGFSFYPTSGDINTFVKLQIGGGSPINTTANLNSYNMWRLTDGAGARYMPNMNRWIELVWGMKFAPDNTGWVQVYVDGALVLPQTFRPTMWINDYGMYIKQGIYKQANAVFPETGKSILYYGPLLISLTQP